MTAGKLFHTVTNRSHRLSKDKDEKRATSLDFAFLNIETNNKTVC